MLKCFKAQLGFKVTNLHNNLVYAHFFLWQIFYKVYVNQKLKHVNVTSKVIKAHLWRKKDAPLHWDYPWTARVNCSLGSRVWERAVLITCFFLPWQPALSLYPYALAVDCPSAFSCYRLCVVLDVARGPVTAVRGEPVRAEDKVSFLWYHRPKWAFDSCSTGAVPLQEKMYVSPKVKL